MPGKKEDLRIIKTNRALLQSMGKLLETRNFGEITVNDLCAEAQISRATFYSHYSDKYDLLKYWLQNLDDRLSKGVNDYEKVDSVVNPYIEMNSKLLNNLMKDISPELLNLLYDYISSFFLNILDGGAMDNTNRVLLSNFLSGGFIQLLSQKLRGKYPANTKFVNPYLFGLIQVMLTWDAS